MDCPACALTAGAEFAGKGIDFKNHIVTREYSLAAVFYRMVCGQAPVPAAQRVVADSNPRAKSVNGSLPLYVSQDGRNFRIQTSPLAQL